MSLESWVHPLGSCQFLFFSGRTVVPSMHRSMNDSCKLLCYAVYWAICTDVVFVAPLRHGYWVSPLIWSVSSMGHKKMKFWRLLVAVFHTITIKRQWRFSTNHAIFVWETLNIKFSSCFCCTFYIDNALMYEIKCSFISKQWVGYILAALIGCASLQSGSLVPRCPLHGLTLDLYWEEIALYSQDDS